MRPVEPLSWDGTDHHLVKMLYKANTNRAKRPFPITAKPTYESETFKGAFEEWWNALPASPTDHDEWLDWFDGLIIQMSRVYQKVAQTLGRRRNTRRVRLKARVGRLEQPVHLASPRNIPGKLFVLDKLRTQLNHMNKLRSHMLISQLKKLKSINARVLTDSELKQSLVILSKYNKHMVT